MNKICLNKVCHLPIAASQTSCCSNGSDSPHRQRHGVMPVLRAVDCVRRALRLDASIIQDTRIHVPLKCLFPLGNSGPCLMHVGLHSNSISFGSSVFAGLSVVTITATTYSPGGTMLYDLVSYTLLANCDCDTFRTPPLMSKRTIRTPGEGG